MIFRIAALLLLLLGTAANAQTRQNYVTWPASSSVGTASFTGYKVYRCNPSPCTPTVQIGTTTTEQYFDLGLANSTAYVYKISAYGPGGESFQGTTLTITTDGAPTTRNVTCSGTDIATPLATAIGASSPGDIVNISAGSCTMSGLGQILNFHGTLQGQGIGVTNITADSGIGTFYYQVGNIPDLRLTGFTFTSTLTPSPILVIDSTETASWVGPFRIDHNNFNYPNTCGMLNFFSLNWGVVDHNTFNHQCEAAILIDPFTLAEFNNVTGGSPSINLIQGSTLLALPFRPGAGDYFYIEDNTFANNAACLGGGGCAVLDHQYTGGRVVVRHNTITNSYLFSHWTSKMNVNSLWWEIYANSITWTSDIFEAMRLEGGGTGVIYNNTITGLNGGSSGGDNVIQIGEQRLAGPGAGGLANSGSLTEYCDTADSGPQTWDNNLGDVSAVGWPCLAQTGRAAGVTMANIIAGTKQQSFPLYLWKNGPTSTCQTGGSCTNTFGVAIAGGPTAFFKNTPHTVTGGGQGQGDVDWCINATQPTGCGTHTLNYTPYTYPHPLNH